MDIENSSEKTNYDAFKNRYNKLEEIGSGSYGKVYKAKDSNSKDFVALKKIKLEAMGEEGIPYTTLREMSILS